MKTTTTLEEIVRTAAYRNHDFDDIFNNDTSQLITFGSSESLIYQISKWTPMISQICEHEVFGEYDLADKSTDKFFKQAFMTRFINREIAFQTIDLFRPKLVSMMVINEQWLINVYTHFADMFENKHTTSDQDDSNYTDEGRSAHVTLPQDKPQVDLNDDQIPYANTTDANKFKHTATDKKTGEDDSFNPDVIEKLNQVYDKKLKEFDKKLFLQVW